MVDEVDEHRQPERVREQDELLTLIGCDVSHIGQEADARHPFRIGERLLDGELVQMPDEPCDQRTQPRVGAVLEPCDHLPGEITCGGVSWCQVVAHSYPT